MNVKTFIDRPITSVMIAVCIVLLGVPSRLTVDGDTVYIILCCLYESLLIPLSVMLVIPFGLLGSFILSSLLGTDNNVYMQTGLVMLIGMLAKTAILLTEVSVERRRKGRPLHRCLCLGRNVGRDVGSVALRASTLLPVRVARQEVAEIAMAVLCKI